MALAIATNNAALNAAASASSVNKEMETSMARLSSGKRINSASDDAAGVAISSRLSAEIRGTDQAIRNSLDGQAMIDTAEGAHKEIENILQRMREVSVQAANDTNNDQDRLNLQQEVVNLVTEIERISKTTTWAGETLMTGDLTEFSFQVGSKTATENQIEIGIKGMGASNLGFSIKAPDGPVAPTNPATLSDFSFSQSGYQAPFPGNVDASASSPATLTASVKEGENIDSSTGLVVLNHGRTNANMMIEQNPPSDEKPEHVHIDLGNMDTSLNNIRAAMVSAGYNSDELYVVVGGTGNPNGDDDNLDFRIEGSLLTNTSVTFADETDPTYATPYATFSNVTLGSADVSFTATVPAAQTNLVINDPSDATGFTKFLLVSNGPGMTGTDTMRAQINAATATHGLHAEIDHAGIFTIRTAVATDPGGANLPATPADLMTLRSNYEPVTRPASNPFVPATTVYDTSTATPEVLATDDASLSSSTLTIKSPQPSAMSITVGSENYHFTSSDNAQSIAQKINDSSGATDSGAGTSVHGTTATAQPDGTILFATYVAPEAEVPLTLVTTQADAHQTIRAIDLAIKDVNMQRSTLGAVSNRLGHTINNLTNISTNLSAAQGGIEDADFAFETTNLAKNQILQQASTAMLAQANASKQNVLSLLQG